MNCKCQQPNQGISPYSGQMYAPNTMMQHHPNQFMGAHAQPGMTQPSTPMAQPQYGTMDYGANHQSMTQGYPNQNQMVGGYQQQPQNMNMQAYQPAGHMGYPQAQTEQQQMGYPQPGQPQVGNNQMDQGMPQYGAPMHGPDQPSQPVMPTYQNATNYPMPGQGNQNNGYPGAMPQPGYIPEEHDDDFD